MEEKREMKIKIAGVEFNNPIWVASGTFGAGTAFADFLDLKEIGAIVTKTITLNARIGNKPPRVVETSAGLLNSIGLENKGADFFKKEIVPEVKKIGTKIIVSIAGETAEEMIECMDIITDADFPAAVEINLSCPNVSHGDTKYNLISQDPEATGTVLKKIKKKSKVPVIAKLTPNVTDVSEIALAAERAGADAVALVNTYAGLAIDARNRKPLLGNVIGGLSGPAIKPLALKAVWDTYKKVSLPIIGIGGIMSGIDVAEFLLAGATCVQVGTANLVDPDSAGSILEELREYIKNYNIDKIEKLTGALRG